MLNIYLAEDNDFDTRYIERSFKKSDEISSLKSFCNGEELINELKKAPFPDCILLDMGMPIVDGYEVLEFLQSTHDQSTIVFIMTSSDEHRLILKEKGCRPDGFVAKPVDVEEFFKLYEEKNISG